MNNAIHLSDCEYAANDNPWSICTCGTGSPNNPPTEKPPVTTRDRARWFVRDFSREVGFAMSDAQTEVMLNLFLRYADPIPVSGQELIDRVFKCVTGWVNDKNIPFDDQNALFRGLAYAMKPFEQKLPEDFVKDRKDSEAIRAFFGNARTSTNVVEQNAALPASTNRLTDVRIVECMDEADKAIKGQVFETSGARDIAWIRAIIATTEAK